MDTPDRLDLLLDRSAPDAVHIDDALTRDLVAATAAARAEVAAERGRIRRIPRAAAGLGLAVLLCGGAGAAVAAGGFEWLPWAQEPDVAYAFTLPSGRECEARMVLEQTEPEGDWGAFVDEVGRLTIDQAIIDRWEDEIRNDPRAIIQVLGADGAWRDAQPGDEPTEDDWSAVAHYAALTDETNRISAAAGIDGWWTSDAQLLCEAVNP
jgi:hypothetical protein